ncbi:hypothetical protein TNCV_570671 [Trichonephila clavipes]|nr:hypothetical protein TNCV_570671 [Trichonephila clavipes]
MIKLGISSNPRGRRVMNTNLVPMKTRIVGERCVLNLSKAQVSSRWCGSLGRGCQLRCRYHQIHEVKITKFVVKSPRVAE